MSKYVLYFGVRSLDEKYSNEVVSNEQYDDASDALSVLEVLKMFYRVLTDLSHKKKKGE